jgi:hypothetical protein
MSAGKIVIIGHLKKVFVGGQKVNLLRIYFEKCLKVF